MKNELYHSLLLKVIMTRTSWVSWHQEGKPFWILLEQVRWWAGSGISWTICKSSAPRSRQITTPVPYQSVFTGRMSFLPPNQQRQSTEGISTLTTLSSHFSATNIPTVSILSLTSIQNSLYLLPFPSWLLHTCYIYASISQNLHQLASCEWVNRLWMPNLPTVYPTVIINNT